MAENYITRELADTIKPLWLLNQDVIRKTWGLWRYLPGGPIIAEEYDYASQIIGPYKFQEFYGYVSEFYAKRSTPRTSLLFKYLCESQDAIACLFVNNTFVARVYPNSIEYISINDPLKRDIRYFEHEVEGMLYLLDVGWVKQKTQCFTVRTAPGRLLMDLDTGQLYVPNRGWVVPSVQPVPVVKSDLALYKGLLSVDGANAVYVGIDGDVKYI